jgi:TRAP-type uncharacterized transport system fused permease subunit
LVPYIYVYHPILLFDGHFTLELFQSLFTALLGVFLLSMGTIGFYKSQVHWFLRLVALAGAVKLLIPGTMTDLAGLAVLVFIHFFQTAKAKYFVHSTTPQEDNQT